MRRFKKVVAVALAATMATGLMAGCGSKTAATTSASTEAAEVATEEQETTEAATEEDTEEGLGVATGDKAVDIQFDSDTGNFLTYTNGGQEEISNVDGQLCVTIQKLGKLDYANQIYYYGFRIY